MVSYSQTDWDSECQHLLQAWGPSSLWNLVWSPIYKPGELGKAWPESACPSSYFRALNIVGQARDNWAWWQTFLVVITWDATVLQQAEVKDAIVQHAYRSLGSPSPRSLCLPPSPKHQQCGKWEALKWTEPGSSILPEPQPSHLQDGKWGSSNQWKPRDSCQYSEHCSGTK